MRRAALFQFALAVQAAIAAAACGYDRSGPHPLTARRVQIAHLLRRAGFGASKEQLDAYESLGLVKTVDSLLNYETADDDVEQRLSLISLDLKKLADMQRWWLLRMIYTKRPLQEKMTLFWHGLLTSGTAKVGLPNPTPQNPDPPHYMWAQHLFLREHATSRFQDILLGISRDPAMMIWLDSQTNVKGKPNENYGRELMELFTLGITGPDGKPNYTEDDVREVARAFTGWGLDRGNFIFRANNHDTGYKKILGKSGNFDGTDVVKILAAHPPTAHHLSLKLWEFFAYPDPSEQDLAPLIQAYTRSGGDVKEMLRALFTSPAFYSPRAYRALVKTPVEYVVGAARTLGVATDAFPLPGVTTRMGQALYNPPNVAGWPGGLAWINSSTWLERVNFGNALLSARDDAHTMAPALAAMLERNGVSTLDGVVDFFTNLLLDGQVSPQMRRTLRDYLGNSPLSGATMTPSAAGKGGASAISGGPLAPTFVDQKARGLVYLIMASAEYQLA